ERDNRLGATLQKPSRVLVEQLDLPDKQGLVLNQVRANSAAAKAGLKANDILLELNDKAVPSNVEQFVKQLNEIKKDTPVDAVVLRKGKRETVKGLKLGDVPANPFGNLPNVPNLPNIQIQPLQAVPGNFRPAGISMNTTRGADGSFTTKYKEGVIAITLQGKMEGNKANVSSIEIRDGDQTSTYKTISDVPEDLREDVRALIRAVESGKVTNRIKLGAQ